MAEGRLVPFCVLSVCGPVCGPARTGAAWVRLPLENVHGRQSNVLKVAIGRDLCAIEF